MLNIFKANAEASSKDKLKDLNELIKIRANYNIPEILGNAFKLGVHVLKEFSSPTILWNVINMLTVILSLLQFKGDNTITTMMADIDITKIISKPSELIEDAMTDMMRALIVTFPSSPVIINYAFQLLDYRLQCLDHSHKSNDYIYHNSTLTFWLYLIRTICPDEQTLKRVKKSNKYLDMILTEKAEESIEIIIDIIIEYVLHNCYPLENIPALSSAISNWMGNFIKDSSLESISQLFTLIDVAVMSSYPIDITNYLIYSIEGLLKLPEHSGEMTEDKYRAGLCLMIARAALYRFKQFEEAIKVTTIDALLKIWISRVDFAISDYSKKINIAAILSVTSKLTPSLELLSMHIKDIAPLLMLYAKVPRLGVASPGKLQNEGVSSNDKGFSAINKFREAEIQKMNLVQMYIGTISGICKALNIPEATMRENLPQYIKDYLQSQNEQSFIM